MSQNGQSRKGPQKRGSVCLLQLLTTSVGSLLWILMLTFASIQEVLWRKYIFVELISKKNQKIIFMRQKMESGALKPVQRFKVREALSFAVACENVSQCILFFSSFSHRYRNNYARIKNGPVERFCLMDGETGLLLSARYRSSQGICWSNSFDGKTVLLFANHCRRKSTVEGVDVL